MGNEELQAVIERIRPTVLSGERILPVPEPLQSLFPHGGLARGSRLSVRGAGAASLVMHSVAAASREGSWIAVVGVDAWGWAAAVRAGWSLERCVTIAEPPTSQWGTVVAALIESVDVVVVDPVHQVGATDARRLVARAREQGAVVVDLTLPDGRRRFRWPTDPDVTLTVEPSGWDGLGAGHGLLSARRLSVTSGGRRGAARARQVEIEITASGELRPVDPAPSTEAGRHLRSVG